MTNFLIFTKTRAHKNINIWNCGEDATNAKLIWKKTDQANNPIKFLSMEALRIKKLKLSIKTTKTSGEGSRHLVFVIKPTLDQKIE